MSPVLSNEQRASVSRVDAPEELTGGAARNIGERDVTIRRVGPSTWIYKAWQQSGGAAFVYAPARRSVQAISSDQYLFLTDASSPVLRPEQMAWLDSLLAAPGGRGWSFPNIPDGARVEQPRVRVLMLNPTEQCNIRCTYCYYGGAYEGTRQHQTLVPSRNHTEAAIDIFFSAGDEMVDAQRAIYFFGGEPLLGMPQLREAVAYLDRVAPAGSPQREHLIVQVNSNGMLLTPTIVDFLVEHDIYLNISIDGPNHDRYRVDARGRGTHDRVRAKVEWLHQEYPDYFSSRVALICVLSAPLDTAGLYRYFSSWPAALDALAWDFDLVLPGGDGSYDEFEALFREQRRVWTLFEEAHRQDRRRREASGRYRFAFSHGFLHRSFHRALNQRPQEPDRRLEHLLGVQAVPGNEYLVLGADGTLYSSYEFQSPAFATGTADAGVLPDAGVEQLRAFREAVQASSCTTCWAAPMCTVTVPEVPVRASDPPAEVEEKSRSKVARCRSERENLARALETIEEIRTRYGSGPLDEHRDEWALAAAGASKVSYFHV